MLIVIALIGLFVAYCLMGGYVVRRINARENEKDWPIIPLTDSEDISICFWNWWFVVWFLCERGKIRRITATKSWFENLFIGR